MDKVLFTHPTMSPLMLSKERKELMLDLRKSTVISFVLPTLNQSVSLLQSASCCTASVYDVSTWLLSPTAVVSSVSLMWFGEVQVWISNLNSSGLSTYPWGWWVSEGWWSSWCCWHLLNLLYSFKIGGLKLKKFL